ncbi:MAG TPA: sugar transferase [Opitutaceae bacterium]|nr:sugar transferase [Opitutaceae bacterium]
MFHETLGSAAPLPRWKRSIDLACCVFALPFLALCAALVAILMSISSRGPIFFRQDRVGYKGRRFRLYKFRTMHVAVETASHQAHFAALVQSNAPMQKMDSRRDSRLIPGGWLIRASGLDELPQILNVWQGDMSIVGPRPCIPYEYEQYTAEQRARFDAVPGLTGLWQVSGKNRTTFNEMISLDIAYAGRKSAWLDLKIIALTPFALAVQILDTRRGRRSSAAKIPVREPQATSPVQNTT